MISQSRLLSYGIPLLAFLSLIFTLSHLLAPTGRVPLDPPLTPPKSPYSARIGGVGKIEPRSDFINIGVHTSGIVQKVYVAVGEKVKKGDPLLTLDERAAQASLLLKEAHLNSAQVACEDMRRHLNFYESIKDKRAISQEELVRRRYGVKRAEAALKEAQAAVKEARTTLEQLTVFSPLESTILAVNIHEGEYALAGSRPDHLITLGDLSTLYARVEVDEISAQHVLPTAPAKGYLRGQGERPIDLKFVRLEPLMRSKKSLTANNNEIIDTRVLQVIYAFNNKDIGAYPGQQMDVYIDAHPSP